MFAYLTTDFRQLIISKPECSLILQLTSGSSLSVNQFFPTLHLTSGRYLSTNQNFRIPYSWLPAAHYLQTRVFSYSITDFGYLISCESGYSPTLQLTSGSWLSVNQHVRLSYSWLPAADYLRTRESDYSTADFRQLIICESECLPNLPLTSGSWLSPNRSGSLP